MQIHTDMLCWQFTFNNVAINAVSVEQLLVSSFKQFTQTVVLLMISVCVKILQKILSIYM